jgi:hypothetical protein
MSKKRSTDLIVTPDEIQGMVRVVRGQRVMLDFDLARLYGVTTARLNEQVARNRDRFPGDFAYLLTQQEFMSLMSQNAISKPGLGGSRRKAASAFTEHGVAILSGRRFHGHSESVRLLRPDTARSYGPRLLAIPQGCQRLAPGRAARPGVPLRPLRGHRATAMIQTGGVAALTPGYSLGPLRGPASKGGRTLNEPVCRRPALAEEPCRLMS